MVGLLPDRPQRGKSGITNLARVVAEFDALFAAYCRDVLHGRATGEKALQSYLISESHKNGRRLVPINAASRSTDDPVELLFITDEHRRRTPGVTRRSTRDRVAGSSFGRIGCVRWPAVRI